MKAELRTPALWGHLHALTVLAEAGSFTAAAQRLGLSKAAMSQRVAELERAAGLPLVRRTTRSVRLTEAGQQLADAIRGAFSSIDQACAGVRDLAGEPRGLLRVTAPVALARQQLVPRLPGFLREYPGLRLELALGLVRWRWWAAMQGAFGVPDRAPIARKRAPTKCRRLAQEL